MVEAVPAAGTEMETGEVLVSLSNRLNEAWAIRIGFHTLRGLYVVKLRPGPGAQSRRPAGREAKMTT